MKNNLLKLILGTCLAFQTIGQNPSWILPSKHLISGNLYNLPTPTFMFGDPAWPVSNDPYRGYIGQLPTNASNMISNAQGEIEFFIVDDLVYDRNGDYIHQLTNENGEAVKGASEIVVIPNPTNCEQYYIVSTLVESDSYYKIPYVFLLDMSILNPNAYNTNNCASYGAFIELGSGSYPWGLSINSISNGAFELYDQISSKKSNIFIAGSDLTANNERLVFISNGQGIHRFKIGASGFLYENAFIPFPNPEFNPERSRSEMELIKLPNNNFRIAAPYVTTGTVTGNNINGYSVWQNLYTAELDPNGNLIPSTVKEFPLNQESVNSIGYYAAFKGVEFSQDGRFLYVTHSTNTIDSNPFEYFDFNNPTSDLMPITVGGGINLRYSMLELGANNALYMANENGLYKMSTSASIPSGTLQSVFSFNNTATHEGTTVDINKKMYMLQDQIDGMDYSVYQFANQQCCLDNQFFHTENKYEVNSTSIWQDNVVSGGSNPLITGNGNIIYIKKELRVKAGATLTIKNMIIQFAPGARLVVENSPTSNGQGGKLILDGTILTMDNRCESNEMWLGVEVWGNQTLTQGSFNNSNQGRLELKNNSIIEHAHIGTLVGKRQPKLIEICPGVFEETYLPYTFDNQRTGGIVQSTNSFYFGNQRGVWFQPYISGTSNNLSVFTNTEFKWNGPLIDQNLYFHAHAQLEEVFGVRFLGSDFINHDVGAQSNVGPSGQGDGYGIVAQNSQFYVDARCVTAGITPVGTPCANLDRCKFLNLFMGISTSNSDTRTFRCDKNDFINCRYGIYVRGTKKERISRNNFFVREALYQCAGLAMYNSSEYTVQENAFDILNNTSFTDSDAISYGIVVNSSGIANNDIYKNTFKNLMIGGQAEKQNAQLINTLNNPETTPFMMSGLTWTCNNFVSNVRKHDLTVVGGNIDYWQGFPNLHNNNLEGIQNSARNTFSLVGEPFVNAHDIAQFSGQKILYTHLNQANHTPDSFTDFMVQPHLIIGAGNMPISPIGNTCPSKLDVKPIKLKSDLIVKRTELKNHKDRMSGGVSSELLSMILTENNPNTIKSELLSKSPFLSDEVLFAYLNSSASSSMKKEVLLANTKLSQSILDAVSNSNLPNGTKNQIYAAQNNESLKSSYYLTLSRLEGEYDYLYNDLLSQTMLNSEDTTIIQSTIDLTSELGDIESKKLKVHALINKGELQLAENLRQELILELGNDDNLELIRIHKDIRPIQATVVAIENQPSLGQELENIRDFSIDGQVRKRAAYLLELRDGITEVPLFLPLINSSAMEINSNEVNEVAYNLELLKVISMYPNPSAGEVFFDFPELNEGILSIKLMDINGKEIYSYISESKSNGERVDLSSIKKGFYLVQINIDGEFLEMQKLLLK